MKRAVLPLAFLIGTAWLIAGAAAPASAASQETPTVKTGSPAAARDTVPDGKLSRTKGDLEMEIVKISGDQTGNKRYPGVCENTKGDRLVIFRGPNSLYWYSFCRKGGSWSASTAIPNQMKLEDHTNVDVEADSTGRFHCLWEEPDVCVVYASFLEGDWTTPVKLPLPGKHDMGVTIAVRSNDQVIASNATVIRGAYLTKDVFFYLKDKGENKFTVKNMIGDAPSSTQPSIAVADKDHVWLAYKSEPKVGSDELVIKVAEYGRDDKEIWDKTITEPEGWNFWPQIAVNSEGKVMVGFARTQHQAWEWRLYDPETEKWTEVFAAGPGIPLRPWATFWSKMVAHDTDFYWAVMDPGRVVHLLRFNEEAEEWDDLGIVSRGGVEYYDLYSGYDKLLIAWSEAGEPSNVFLTLVGVEPYSKLRIQSVANLQVEHRVERGFFHGYYLNALSWEANPLNTEQELVISAHRIYRKGRTEGNDAWTRITEVGGTVMAYEDRNLPEDSDFVYAVTCVDDAGNESPVF
jgi:hypothetical protein